MAGSYSGQLFNFLRSFQIVSHVVCTILHSREQRMRVPMPCCRQQSTLICFVCLFFSSAHFWSCDLRIHWTYLYFPKDLWQSGRHFWCFEAAWLYWVIYSIKSIVTYYMTGLVLLRVLTWMKATIFQQTIPRRKRGLWWGGRRVVKQHNAFWWHTWLNTAWL